ncbi:MAG: NAD(P)-dependent oxidoreductase [Chloroflexi bacterium]|nr:NAD(P)-dependent oxidoreductase [Chloroflexota bacterium]
MNIVIAGATGAIGRPLVAHLLKDGHNITAITRSPESAGELSAQGMTAVVVDVFDREKLIKAVVEAQPEVVIHQLTSIPANLDVRNIAEEFVQTNRIRTEGTRNLMDAAVKAGARQFIAQSYGALYSPHGQGLATEDQPLYLDAPDTFVSLVQAIDTLENIVLNTPGITGTVLRYGHFYGPGTGYTAEGVIVDAVRKRQMPIIGGGNAVFSFIHVEDAAAATVLAVNHGKAGIFNIVDDDPVPLHEWLPVYVKLLDAPQPMRLPKLIGRIAAGRYVLYIMTEMRGASNAKAKRELGWQPHYASWRDGFRAEFAQLEKQGAA